MFKSLSIAVIVTVLEMFLYYATVFLLNTRNNTMISLRLLNALTVWHPAFWTVAVAVFTCTFYATKT